MKTRDKLQKLVDKANKKQQLSQSQERMWNKYRYGTTGRERHSIQPDFKSGKFDVVDYFNGYIKRKNKETY